MGVEERFKKRREEEEKKQKNTLSSTSEEKETKKLYNGVENRFLAKNIDSIASEINSRLGTWFKNNNNYISNFQDRFSKVTGSYTDPYDSGISDWISTVSSQKSNFDAEAASLKKMLETYGNYFDSKWVNSTLESLDKASKAQSDIINISNEYGKYWSQWDSEDAYNEAMAAARKWDSELKGYTIDKGMEGYTAYEADLKAKAESAEEAKKDEKWYEKIGRYLSGATADTSLPTGTLTYAQEAYNQAAAEGTEFKPADDWTDEERSVFGYLYKNGGDYREYARKINLEHAEASRAGQLQKVTDSATGSIWGGIGNTLGSLAASTVGGTFEFLDYVMKGNAGLNPNEDYSRDISLFDYQQGVTGAISEKLNDLGTLNENISVIGGKGWGDVYQIGYSIAQSGMVALSGNAALSGSTFFGSSAASGIEEAKSRGATDEQAVLLGTMYGLAEMAAEQFSIDKLVNIGASDTLAAFFKNVLKQGGVEASEEAATSLFNLFSDNLVMADKSELNLLIDQYIAEGMTEEEAIKRAWLDTAEGVAYDTLTGFISGSVHAGGQQAIQQVGQQINQNTDAKQLYGNNAQELVTEALEINPSNAYAQKMQARVDSGKNLSGAQLGRLVKQNESAMRENDATTIQKAAESRLTELGERGDVKVIASALTKQVKGERLTFTEREAIKSSTFGERVANELNTDNIKSGGYSSAWAEKIGTDRINAEEYSRKISDTDAEESSVTPKFVTLSEEQRREADGTVSKTEKVETSSETENKTVQKPDVASEGLTEDIETSNATYETAEVKEASEGKNEADATGSKMEQVGDVGGADNATTIKVDGRDVSVKIKEIASAYGGSIKLRLENDDADEIVDANEVDFGNDDTALVYQAAADMSTREGGFNTDTVRVMVNGFDPSAGLKAFEYVYGFRDAYRLGAEGAPISELARGAYTSKLTEEQRNRAFHFGRAFGNEEVAQAQAKLDAKKERGLKKRSENAKIDSKTTKEGDGAMADNESTSYYDGDSSTLEPRQRASVEFLEKVFGNTGVKFVFYASYTDESGRRVYKNRDGKVQPAPNGYYLPSDGSIWIDLYAGDRGEGTILITAAHELTHFIKDWSPKKYRAFAEFLYEQYGKNDIRLEAYVRDKITNAKKIGRSLSYEGAYEEVVADSCEMMLVDIINNKNQDNLRKLIAKDKTLFEKIKEFFADLLERVKAEYKGIAPHSYEGRYIREMRDVADKLQTMWTEALLDATDTYSAAAETNTATSEGATGGYGEEVVSRGVSYVIFDPAEVKNIDNENPTVDPDIRYSFRDSTSGMANDALRPYNEELAGFIKNNGNYIVDSFEKLEQIVNLAFDNPTHKATAYFGIINAETLEKIKNSIPNLPKTSKDILFKTGRDYSIATTLDSIRHIVDDKALTRDDVINYLDRLADTILEFDSVAFNFYDKGKDKIPGLLFKKNFSDGTLVSFDLVSHKKRSMILQTLYMDSADYQKKKSAETLPMQKANGNTSETQVGQTSTEASPPRSSLLRASSGVPNASTDIISHSEENVNSKFSENVETEDIRYSDRDDFYELKRDLKEKYGVDTEATLQMADGYLQNYGGVLNKTQFRMQFLDMALEAARFMQEGEQEIFSRLNEMVLETATEIVNNPAIGGELADELRKIKRHIKDTRIKIPSGRKGDFDVFGGFEAFRRKHWGSLTLTHDGIDVDSIYPEFQELFGKSWFPDNIDNVSDQLIRIAEVVDTPLSEVSENYYNPDEIMIDVAGEIFDKVQTIALNASENMARINYRNADSVSPRALLAGALESVAQNDIEKNKLKAYKEKIGKINAEEQKLQGLRREIRELSFATGPRDTARIEALREEATKTANRIGIYDKQLLELEASRPLRDVLQRERHKAYKRAEAEGREALAKYRERAAKTQEELKRRYQESKKRGTENRRKTEMRHKIRGVVGELNNLLLHGSKNRNIKSGLQEAVAAALEAVNMDTLAADERVAKYNELIAKATDEDVIASLVKTRDNIRRQGDVLGDKLEAMRKAYRDIREKDKNGDYPDYFKAEAKMIESRIESVIDTVGDTPLRNMSYKQLDAVYDMYKMVLATVRNANAVFKAGKIEDLQKNVTSVMTELSAIPKLPEERSAAGDVLRGYVWNELIPYYAFERIGSETFESFYWEAVKGQDVYARDIDEAHDFASEAREKYHYDAWDLDKVHEFKLADGRKFSVSLKHMMSVYAYSKRPQAGDHMRKGGFFFNDKETFREKGGVLKMIRDSEASYKLDDGTLAAIVSAMTEEQRKYVDDMQAYMTQMGEKGNEVTRILWGIDLFKEKVYFPLKSSKDFIYQANQPVQESSLKNDGMTKETKPGASNPIVLEAFDDVWATHVNRMSQYHAFVLPIENLNKVLNYGTWANTDAVAVSTMLRSRYGSAVNDYLNQFIGDLNGVKNSQGAKIAIFSSMFTKFKKTAVAGSLSVVVQQPTAILRAQAEIDARYFVGKPNMEKLSEKWEEIKKYAPIAIIKEIGGFEAGAGRQTTEWLNADTQRGLEKVSSKIDEATMWGAAKADQLGWSMIWEAVKRETLSKHRDLVPTSEEFLKLVGERFTEVIVKTQVYDSTLSRSGYMRSKNELTKMMTSFMGEPTVSANMLYDSVIEAKRGSISKRTAARRIGAVYLAVVAATLAKSVIYALRDDDEDESYAEKYAQALGGAVIGDINPLTWLPGVRDVLSIFDGWEVERSDMALFQDLKNAIDGLDSDSKSTWRKIEDFAGAVASFFGLPLKNVMRTAREVYNGFENMVDGVSGGDFGDALLEGVTGKEAGKSKSLYDAIMSGDEERLAIYREDYKSEDAYDAALRKAIRENDPRIKEAAAARYNGDIAEYMRIAKEIIGEGNFSQDNIVAAINSETSALKKAAESGSDTSDEQSDKLESIYRVDDFYKAIRGYDLATAYAVREDIINVAIENGEDREDAEKAFESSLATHLAEEYKYGSIGDAEAVDMLINYGGKSETQAASKVRYWAFKLENPEYDDFYESDVNKYYDGYYKEGELYGKSAASYGISLDTYAEYVREKSGLSKKENIMYIINTLPLTKEQKDALYYLNGWAKSTIREAPWR